MGIADLLTSLGLSLRREGSQLVTVCPNCGDESGHLYLDPSKGVGHCKKCGWSPNTYKLVEKIKPGISAKEIFDLLTQFGLHDPQPQKSSTSDFREECKRIRDLTPEELEQVCSVKGLPVRQLLKLGPRAYLSRGGEVRLVLPAFNPSNTGTVPGRPEPCGYLQCALDGSLIPTSGGKQPKYPQVPGGKIGLLGLPWLLQENPKTILVCEAWRDMLAAMEAGYHAVASTGGASTRRTDWLPLFVDRHVLICTDQDHAGGRHRRELGELLLPIALSVRQIILPYPMQESHGKDLYDLLSEGQGPEHFPSLVAQAHPVLPGMLDGKTVYNLADKTHQEALQTYALVNHKDKHGFLILPDDQPDTIAREYEKRSQYKHKYHPADGWSMYKDGRYQRIDEKTQLRRYVSAFMQKCKFRQGKKAPRVKLTESKIKDVIREVSFLEDVYLYPSQAEPCSLDESLDPNRTIAVANGLVDWRTWPPVLREPTPAYYTRMYLPYRWEGLDAKCELWEEFLVDATNGDVEVIHLLQQWAGYCLMKNHQEQQRFMLIQGEAATGKSVFVDVASAMIGRENVSYVSLCQFNELPALTASYGKMLNVSEESRETVVDPEVENALKRYTGGTMVEWRRLYCDHFFAYPTAKIMIVTNHLPRFKDTTEGVWRRVLLCQFNHVIPASDQIKDLAAKIIADELPGVLAWALHGARSLLKANDFICPESLKAIMQAYRLEAQPELIFLQDYCEPTDWPDDFVTCAEVHRMYDLWLKQGGFTGKKSLFNFGRSINKLWPQVERKQKRRNGKAVYHYIGLRFKSDTDLYAEMVKDDQIEDPDMF